MNILVTGGAGFIGRWVVKKLMELGHYVFVLDDLSNGSLKNLEGLKGPQFSGFYQGDIKDIHILDRVFANKIDICYHLAASINVQDSIDDPRTTFNNDVVGTFNVLEKCREHGCKMLFMSTCMVYDMAAGEKGLSESHLIKPASPYAGSKIAGENLVISYYHAYKLPTVVVRPFNTYGPFQKSGGEGGVVSIFIKRSLNGEPLNIYGDGTQTRDLLYVEDCADFVVSAGLNDAVNGEIINAGTGVDISINDLALKICGKKENIIHLPHIHPQSEIKKLLCDSGKAFKMLNYSPKISLEEGLRLTRKWIETEYNEERVY